MKNYFIFRCLVMAILAMTVRQAASQDIYSAVKEGNAELAREFLDKDPALLNSRNTDLMTPLNLAAENCQVEMASMLLGKGADPGIGDRENSQPIHLAAISGCIPVLDLLLNNNVDIETRDINGMTPLLFAASRGQVEMVKHLVGQGADVKAENINGLSVLHMATYSGNVAIMSWLVDKGARVNSRTEQGYTPLHTAVAYGRTDAVKFLVENGADIEAETGQGEQPLAMAAGRNSYEAAQSLISAGADVNHRSNDGFTALHNVAGRGTIPVAQLLVENGADVNASTPNGFVPLTYAAWAGNAGEMGKFLILHGADVNPDPCKNVKSCTCGPNFQTPLHAACQFGKQDLAEELVNSGAKVNLLSNAGLTPLHYAVKSGKLELVRFLVGHGAFLDVKEKEMNSTELHLAAAMGFGDIARFLMESGSSAEVRDVNGNTPLDYAFCYGQDRIGYSMLAYGADDSRLASYISEECLLSKDMGQGEASVWYLGHSGWAVKTRNHFLVFDYFDDTTARKPDQTGIESGIIDTADIKDLPLTVFSTHDHPDHFSRSVFTWSQANPNTNYILCFNPSGVTGDYTYIPVNSEKEVDGMDVYVIKSTDSGGGYLVEVDGLVIFHMGDHANGEDALSAEFTREIDLVAEKNKNIDILFGPVLGCSLGTPAQVKSGTYYTLEKLHPALFIPMHSGNYTFRNKEFVDQAKEDGLTQPMKYVVNAGDRFVYIKGEDTVRVF